MTPQLRFWSGYAVTVVLSTVYWFAGPWTLMRFVVAWLVIPAVYLAVVWTVAAVRGEK